jgi:hypothetical protein
MVLDAEPYLAPAIEPRRHIRIRSRGADMGAAEPRQVSEDDVGMRALRVEDLAVGGLAAVQIGSRALVEIKR